MAVAMTGYSVSGTYAKYTSKIDLTDEARVASWSFAAKDGDKCVDMGNAADGHKWVCEETNKLDLFADSYSIDNGLYVKSFDGDKVVAPGTTGEYKVRFGGAMEVRHDFKLSFDTSAEVAVWYKVNTDADGKEVLDIKNEETTGYKKYSPIEYTFHLYGNGADKTYTGNLDTIKTKLNEWNNDAANDFAPGRLGMALDLSWKWATMNGFADNADVTSNTKNADGLTAAQVNELDTYIGKNWSKWYPDVDHKGGENDLGNEAKYTLTASATQIAKDYSTKTN